MIPHRLNLLSPKKRNHLNRMINFQFLKNILELCLIFISLIGIALLGGQLVLQEYFNDITSQIVSVNNKYGDTNMAIKQINLTLAKTENIQKEYTKWTPLIIELFNAVPEGVNLSSVNLNKQNKIVNLVGSALTRNDLLLFKENLEKINWLSNIDIPPSQLIEKDNIQFSLSPIIK